ncbi:MAG: hypothetical protein WCF04_14385 [Candidatus Nanopelagicales bacterium]
MRVLYVCTANICRSPSAQGLMCDALATVPEVRGVQIRSAGTTAIDGMPGCHLAPGLEGRAHGHRSQPLTPDLVRWANLILTAGRDHRSVVVTIDPSARRRTFTMLQAGRISDWLVDIGMVDAAVARASCAAAEDFDPADPRAEVAAMPARVDERWGWLVSELDAARGGCVAEVVVDTAADDTRSRRGLPRRWVRRSRDQGRAEGTTHPDDVPDPHVLGAELHANAYEQIKWATEALARLMILTAKA